MGKSLGWVAAVCAVLVACGSNSGGSGSAGGKPPAPPPPPPASQNFTVTVTLDGAGSVSSAPAGIDCGRACTAQFPQGASVALTAAAAPGYQFTGWDGACKGTSPCAMTLSADAAVTVHFKPTAPPPPQGRHALTVTVQGQGSVTSSPQGIDCGQTCSANFADAAQVTLTAAAASGWQFSGWSGACNGSTCTVTMSSDQTATATFTQVPPPPPPPADDCAGLMPASVPAPVVASLPQNECIEGTSDDGTGNYALGYTAGAGPTYPNYLFFTIQDGKAVQIGGAIPGGDESTTRVYSQPSGFTSFHQFGPDGGSWLGSWSHDGQLRSQQVVAAPSFDHGPSSAAGVDPSGGTATLRHVWDGTQWSTLYKRFDKTGAAETGDVVIDHLFPGSVAAVGVALSGDALLIEDATNHQFFAQWVSRDGAPIGTRFNLFGQGAPVVRFLMDGSVVVGVRTGFPMAQYQNISWTYQVQDGVASAGPAPDWIAKRAGDVFWPIRGGKGYAMVGSSMCGAGAVEILAASTAKSCGCMKAPGATSAASVGRDGSLIVPHAPEQFGTCRYDLYPQLLKQGAGAFTPVAPRAATSPAPARGTSPPR